MKRMRRTTIALVLLLAASASLLLVSPADSENFPTYCNGWSGYRVVYYPGYGGYCGGYGGVCSECSTGYHGGYTVCVCDSYDICICTDYQDMSW